MRKCRGRIHIASNIVEVPGEYSRVPNPAKIEVKQAVTTARSRSTQSRDARQVLYKRHKQHDHKKQLQEWLHTILYRE